MFLARHALLALSTSRWLRDRATRSRIVRRSVARFMPGERLEDALLAARALQARGITTILTRLGENLGNRHEADEVVSHYLHALDSIHASGLDAQISVKLTQLGLDFDADLCLHHLLVLADRARSQGRLMWVDMESSPYVDRTLDLFRLACGRGAPLGVALQAYLRRTPDDLESLMPFAQGIRLVKGAYLEDDSIAFSRKSDVDERFYDLAVRLLSPSGLAGPLVHLATHDARLIERLTTFIREHSVQPASYEYAMLYGIQRPLQERLVADGHPVRVLISYGEHWFPWYMRRLAERPANLWFLLRNIRENTE